MSKSNKKNPSSTFEYDGPESLENIEKRLIEIEAEKPARIHNLQENYSGWESDIEALDIAYLDTEKIRLQLRRKFILDKRDGWKARMIWNILVPIVVAVLTAFMMTKVI